jgi:hypothetical protein
MERSFPAVAVSVVDMCDGPKLFGVVVRKPKNSWYARNLPE